MKQRVHTYASNHAAVTWDQRRCIHFAACTLGLPSVFDRDRRPWVEPGAATPEALQAVVEACPTGALHLRLAGGAAPEAPPEQNVVAVTPNGPLYFRGDVTLADEAGDVLLRDTRVALCRCGRSRNKPLCDGGHLDGFRDPGALPEGAPEAPRMAEAPRRTAGALRVVVTAEGPLHVTGPLTLVGADRARVETTEVALCRCGASARKPYCDGSHRRIGFEAPEEPRS